MDKFYQDLDDGKNLEKLAVMFLAKNGYPNIETVPSGTFKSFDLYDAESGISWEIKKDVKSQATGNIIIEYEMPPGNPSALKRTGATYWLIDTGLKLYKITPYKIWMCIAENREKVIKKENMIGNGDTTPKCAYLIPIEIFEPYCVKIGKSLLSVS